MKKITSKKLLNYGAMSAAILAGANASGQIVYTDIDDVTMVPGDPEVFIDLDGDGITDFSFQNFPNSAAVAFPGDNESAFVGFPAGNYDYPSNLSAGAPIDGEATTTDSGERGDLNFYGCAYDNSQFCDGVVDGYLGLVFELNGNTHFGWARFDVAADVATYTLKDFAFNATPDEVILAGDEVLSIENNTIEGLTAFVADNALRINAQSPLENVTIHNLNGQVVVSQKLASTTEIVALNALSTGVYIATVQTEGKLKAIKFVK